MKPGLQRPGARSGCASLTMRHGRARAGLSPCSPSSLGCCWSWAESFQQFLCCSLASNGTLFFSSVLPWLELVRNQLTSSSCTSDGFPCPTQIRRRSNVWKPPRTRKLFGLVYYLCKIRTLYNAPNPPTPSFLASKELSIASPISFKLHGIGCALSELAL